MKAPKCQIIAVIMFAGACDAAPDKTTDLAQTTTKYQCGPLTVSLPRGLTQVSSDDKFRPWLGFKGRNILFTCFDTARENEHVLYKDYDKLLSSALKLWKDRDYTDEGISFVGPTNLSLTHSESNSMEGGNVISVMISTQGQIVSIAIHYEPDEFKSALQYLASISFAKEDTRGRRGQATKVK